MAEKRKHMRLVQEMPLRHCLEQSNDVENTMTKDISAGGVCICTDRQLSLGSRLEVEVAISRMSSPYYALAEVVWLKENKNSGNKKFEMGIRFVRIVSKSETKGF
ncbi:MAG: PilZ domain-containing protein [Candidatus Omnitrophica bacterium]|nr:PilZ domain-containing protein [Candidatus Omnitrophota bacterium]MBU4478268.1 PilZ domain-containing protein [Candidatus Omnitrophota bacterium]MCG2703336.1 PilZ domain-containing protein [Candidatus Omnitrophota bacterium]